MPTIPILSGRQISYDTPPDHCPQCHFGISPLNLQVNYVERGAQTPSVLEILYRCPRQECQRAFIARYWQDMNHSTHSPDGLFKLRRTVPMRPTPPAIEAEVAEVSPTYVEVHVQAAAAEAHGLEQIAGVGYRKALEYLVKDYAIQKNPAAAADAIKQMFLGKCIKDYVADANVKACASRAAWLGNDESHYVRKWTERDIKDLKALLRLTEAWVLNDVLTAKYQKEMDERGTSAS